MCFVTNLANIINLFPEFCFYVGISKVKGYVGEAFLYQTSPLTTLF